MPLVERPMRRKPYTMCNNINLTDSTRLIVMWRFVSLSTRHPLVTSHTPVENNKVISARKQHEYNILFFEDNIWKNIFRRIRKIALEIIRW